MHTTHPRPHHSSRDASWRRAVELGLRPDTIEPSFDVSSDDDGHLERAAEAVTAALCDDLVGTSTSILVADGGGRILHWCDADHGAGRRLDGSARAPGFVWSEKHVGTRAIGTAAYRRTATYLRGDEQDWDGATTTCGAGAPIVDDGRVVGVIAIVRRACDVTGLMVSVARQAVPDIEQQLQAELSARQRLLRDELARARRHTRSALAVVSADTMMMNASAARLLTPEDRAALWEWVVHTAIRRTADAPLRLASGITIDATADLVRAGSDVVGAVLRIVDVHRDSPAPPPSRPPGSAARFGWASLTDAELGVAEQVASGRTNRQVAAQLFISPHTVDSHLRHIYSKLGIASRVQLTRLMMSRAEPAGAGEQPTP
jgi:DNA-binding CsgD family transcriptional regulator/transcriptional regulator of acetoin/glycerol metabolism